MRLVIKAWITYMIYLITFLILARQERMTEVPHPRRLGHWHITWCSDYFHVGRKNGSPIYNWNCRLRSQLKPIYCWANAQGFQKYYWQQCSEVWIHSCKRTLSWDRLICQFSCCYTRYDTQIYLSTCHWRVVRLFVFKKLCCKSKFLRR